MKEWRNQLFTPKKIADCEITNRLIVPAMVTNYCTEDGMLTERYMKYIEEKAKGDLVLLSQRIMQYVLLEKDMPEFLDYIMMNR